jgi:PAS domain S-box-containing protein
MAHRSNHAPASILIVDDEPAILEIVSQFLADRGYRVSGAETAAEALRLSAGGRFDVALVDLKLPDRSGIELLAPLSERNPAIACIIMTAFASVESTIEALRLNAFDYILKPFDLAKIGEAVDAAVQQARLRSESESVLARLEARNRKLEAGKEALARELAAINDELRHANESLKRHVTRLRVLYQMGRDISSNENWSDALDRFLMAFCKYLEADGAALLLFSNNAHELKVRTSYQLETEFLDETIDRLAEWQRRDVLPTEIFSLDGAGPDGVRTCLSMTARWTHTAVPLLYKSRWLGFLAVRKRYRSRTAYVNDYHFVNTIQTILSEEVANAVNISRLRQLKDFNETVLENMNGGVLATDSAGRIAFLNERARELTGGAVPGSPLDGLFVNPFGGGGLFEHLLARAEESCSFECLLAREGGRSIPVRLNTARVKRDEHHGRTVIVVFEDLTAEKRMEEELRRADRLRSLGELSAGVAHEIRNPLTGIATTAQVLREKLAGDRERVAYIDVILEEIARLDGIIRSLLNFARPVAPRPAEVSLGGVVEDALRLLEESARDGGVTIRFENALADDRCVLDGDQIKQVVLNVALNGIQACSPGGRLTVRLREAPDPACVEIELADTGGGIPEEIADKLYNPFFTTRPEGTGMGLSISRKIAESHGGRIRHRSVPGAGTSFFVELPRMAIVTAHRAAAPAAN